MDIVQNVLIVDCRQLDIFIVIHKI